MLTEPIAYTEKFNARKRTTKLDCYISSEDVTIESTRYGTIYVKAGYVIVTDGDGIRYAYEPETFNRLYERI